MKNILTTIILFTILSCKAQQIIVPLGGSQDYQYTPNYYVKDVNLLLNKYIGTWKYTNGATEITLTLKKEIHYTISNTKNYQDLLVGEYQYIDNGIEKINTLIDLNNPLITGYEHKISGSRLISTRVYPPCINCALGEKRLDINIKDPTTEFAEGRLILRHLTDVNGIERLETFIYDKSYLGDGIIRIKIPNGEYTFIKQ